MMVEKVIAIFGIIFVTSFVAKYIGPTVYGKIALSLSVFQLIQIVSQFGSDVLIFKRISVNVKSGVNLINNTLFLRVISYILLSTPVLIYFYFTSDFGYIFIVSTFIACFIQVMDVYAIFYDACLKSMVNVLVNLSGLVISMVFRGIIPLFELNYSWLALPIIIAPLVPFIIRFYYFNKKEKTPRLKRNHSIKYMKYLFFNGFSFAVSSISVALYTRISIFIIGIILTTDKVAIFTVASSLASSWSFVLYSFITSTLPSIFSEKSLSKANEKTSKLFWLIFFISLIVIVFALIFAKFFLNLLYGLQFSEAYKPLIILCFCTMISALGTISSRYIAKFSGYSYLSYKTISVCTFSVIITYFSISKFGIVGAAYSNLLTELFSLTIANYFFKHALVLKMHLNTIFYPYYFLLSKSRKRKNENPPHRR